MADAFEDQTPQHRDGIVQRATDWIFGFDYFVSYSHRDGLVYPRSLKERLERAGFRVFLDQTDYAAGTNLSRETRREVLKSKVIVVIGRDGAYASQWVKREVGIALRSGKDPVVIDVNDALMQAESGVGIADVVRGEHWLRIVETLPTSDAEPTQRSVDELIRSFRHTRQRRKRLRLLAGLALMMGALAVAATQQAVVARQAQRKADRERVSAEIAHELLLARNAVAIAEAGDGTAATQIALESTVALHDRRTHPAAKAALDEALRALHTAIFARREVAVASSDRSRGMAIAFSADGSRLAAGKLSGVFEILARDATLLVRGTHAAAITSVAFSPDGGRLLTASRDGTAQQWSATTGERIGDAMRHERGVSKAVYSPDGALILTAGGDGRAALWSATDGHPVRKLDGHTRAVLDARFSPDGRRIATASEDDTVRLWRTTDGAAETSQSGKTLPDGAEQHQNTVRNVAFSPDGRYLVSTGKDHYAVLWNLVEGTSRALEGHDDTLFGAVFDPSSRLVLTYSEDFTARVWSAQTGAFLARLQHDAWVQSGEFSADGTEVLTASKENATRIWDAQTGELKATLLGHDRSEKYGLLATFDPRGELVATTSWDGSTRLWTAAAGAEIKAIRTGQRQVVAASFNRDDRLIATGAPGDLNTGFLDVWNSETGERVLGPVTTPGRIWRVSFHPHRDTLAGAAGWGGSTIGSKIVLLDVESKRTQLLSHAPSADMARPLRSVSYSLDGRFLVSAGDDGLARIWDASSGAPVGEPLDHGGRMQFATFDHTSRRLATGGQDGRIRVWSLADRSHRELHYAANVRVFNLAFTSDGKRLLASLGNGEMGFWELDAEPPRFVQLARMEFEAWAAAMSTDERVIAVGDLGRRGTTALIDAATGNRMAVLKGQIGGIRAVDFSSDGRRLLTASNDGTIWIWPIFASGEALISHAGTRLHRCLSRKERAGFGLRPVPPVWCITGWGLEREPDPEKWRPKWPYSTSAWRDWLARVRKDPGAPMPD